MPEIAQWTAGGDSPLAQEKDDGISTSKKVLSTREGDTELWLHRAKGKDWQRMVSKVKTTHQYQVGESPPAQRKTLLSALSTYITLKDHQCASLMRQVNPQKPLGEPPRVGYHTWCGSRQEK